MTHHHPACRDYCSVKGIGCCMLCHWRLRYCCSCVCSIIIDIHWPIYVVSTVFIYLRSCYLCINLLIVLNLGLLVI